MKREQTIVRGMQQYNHFTQRNYSIYAYIGKETVARSVTQARYSQGGFQVKIQGSTAWLTPSLLWAEEEQEMGELWDGEKWVKSPLVPFGYHQLSLQHLPEPNADTSYWFAD